MNMKTPNDVLLFMDNIKYGWKDEANNIHYDMEDFRLKYRTMSMNQVLEYKVATCIEQCMLIKYLLDKIGVSNEVFCTRIYEDENFNDLHAKERMHCFVLFYYDNKVYQLEHPDYDRKGIYEYKSKEDAINFLVNYYENMTIKDYEKKKIKIDRNSIKRTTTKFDYVEEGLTYKEFNLYVNKLDKQKKR